MGYDREEYMNDCAAGASRYADAQKAQQLIIEARKYIMSMANEVITTENCTLDVTKNIIKLAFRNAFNGAASNLQKLGYKCDDTALSHIDSAINDASVGAMQDIISDFFGVADREVEKDITENQHLTEE